MGIRALPAARDCVLALMLDAHADQRPATHPAVGEAAAVAVPSPVGEDDVLVVVAPVAGGEVDPEELLRFLLPLLPHYMVPRYVRTVAELPKTPTAKVQKHLLRADAVTADTYDREEHGFAVRRERLARS
jgi:crotonobetaine/carnitine-CoA ligase